MFNRVGNLTLLSLSRRRNSIIESLHTFTHEHRSWFERFNLRFPEEEQTDFAAVRIYWRYGERSMQAPPATDEDGDLDMADNASVSANTIKTGGALSKVRPPEHKGYYLFNSSKVEQVERHDYAKIRKNINRRLYEH